MPTTRKTTISHKDNFSQFCIKRSVRYYYERLEFCEAGQYEMKRYFLTPQGDFGSSISFNTRKTTEMIGGYNTHR